MGCEGRGGYNQLRRLGNTSKGQELFKLTFKDMKKLYLWKWSVGLSSRRTVLESWQWRNIPGHKEEEFDGKHDAKM